MSDEPAGNIDVADALKTLRGSLLSNPVRLAIMALLAARDWVSFSTIARALNLTPGNLWSHIDKLRSQGLIEIRYAPSASTRPKLYIRITRKGIRELVQYMRAVKAVEETIKDRPALEKTPETQHSPS
ncbi:MAG: transcriptional regulator [Hyperthermus sp.]|nr:MAG: transcriptional regulator [Hyperthermus sp.]